MHVRSERSDRKINSSSLLRIDPTPTINKWFSIHNREWECRGHLGLDQVLWGDYNERNQIHRQAPTMRNPLRTISHTNSYLYPNSFTNAPCNFPWAAPYTITNPNDCAHSQPHCDSFPSSEVAHEIPHGSGHPKQKSFLTQSFRPSLNPWRHDLCLRHTSAAVVAKLVIQEHLNHIYHPVTGQFKNYDKPNLGHPKHWTTSMSNELGRLASDVWDRMKSSTETIFSIHKHQVPAGRNVTYANKVCDYRPLKYDPYCVIITIGGNRLIYPGDPRYPDVSLMDSKLIFNSTISPCAHFFARKYNIIL